MTKNEFVAAIAEQADLTKKDSEKVLNAFVEIVTASLVKGEKVSIPGFGTFETGIRNARTGRNPQTGETMEIPASKTAKFKAGTALKNAVNE